MRGLPPPPAAPRGEWGFCLTASEQACPAEAGMPLGKGGCQPEQQVEGQPGDPYGGAPGASTSFGFTEEPCRQGTHRAFSSFSADGETHSDSRDGISMISSVRAS